MSLCDGSDFERQKPGFQRHGIQTNWKIIVEMHFYESKSMSVFVLSETKTTSSYTLAN